MRVLKKIAQTYSYTHMHTCTYTQVKELQEDKASLLFERQQYVCCSVLQRVAACCSVLQCMAVCYSVLQCCYAVLKWAGVCWSVLQFVNSVHHCVTLCCSVL